MRENCKRGASCEFCDARCPEYMWDVEKVPDTDSMHYHRYCPKCHFLLGELGMVSGYNYCPNCGTLLKWDNDKFKINLAEWLKISEEHYQKNKRNIKL